MAMPAAPFQQVPGGFDFVDPMTAQENFIDEINVWDFYGDSSTVFMNSIYGKRLSTHTMMNKDLRNTYFMWLPLELIESIFEWERQIEIVDDKAFYETYYFTDEDSVIETVRHLRPTRAQRKLAIETGNVTGLDAIQTPLGHTFGRRVWKNNTAAFIARDFRNLVDTFNKNKATSIDYLFNLISKHLLWIVHHSYLSEWYSFMRVIYMKQIEFEERLAMYDLFDYEGEMPKELATPEQRASVWEKLLKIKYFLAHYVPYSILSQSDVLYNAANSQVSSNNNINTMLFDVYMMTGVHPNSINLQKAREFEMELYAPKYYHETYENYMKLRSGRRLIPEGKKPEFYWCAGKYIQRFI